MAAYIIERFGHCATYCGETAGQAKYNAYLDSESGYDFIGFLQTIDSCKKDKYMSHMMEQQQKPDLQAGDKVKIHTCAEAERYKDRIWAVVTEPQQMCGSWVVWLEGHLGCFACEFLRKVKQ